MRRFALLLVLLAIASVSAAPTKKTGSDWPAWRGPQRTGISIETGLLSEWPEAGPKHLWKATGLGAGFSTPTVAGGVIYVMGNRDGQELVLALDAAAEGKELWATPLGAVRHEGGGYPGPRCSPTVDGDRVYALGMNGDLACLQARTGKIVWKRDLTADFGGAVPNWGYSESVLIDGPWLLCTPGGQQATIAALSKATGKTVWEAKVGDAAGYSSIIKAQIQGLKQYVQLTAAGLIGVDARNGKFLWRNDAMANGTANCSTPLCVGDRVFAASGYGTGGGLVEVQRTTNGFDAREVYFTRQMKNHHGGMVVLDGYLYGCNDPGLLSCLDFATGEVKWNDRGSGKCSLTCADGMLYARSEDGTVSLVEATPLGFKLHGRFKEPERSDDPSWPHPVVANGRLYLRDQDKLFCYDVKR